jgi:hypothetical protein
MANCTYRFTDADGKERVIEGQAAFKAYLASGGLEHLLPGTVIAPALSKRQTETPEFKKWFGNSKVVDDQGEPMVVYRGAYDADKDGTFFSSKPQTASAYAAEEGGFVEPVYMRLANPLEVDAKGGTQMSMPYKGMNVGMTYLLKEAKKEGHDGVIVRDVADMVEDSGTTDYYVSLGKKAQVKSAIGNTGAFGEVNDIRFSLNAKLEQKIFSDFDKAVEEYSGLPDTKNGKLLDTDQARELSPEYRADRSLAPKVHEAASAFTQKAFETRMAKAPDGGLVMFMAGGGGAGKSSAEYLLGAEMDRAGTILDGTLSSYDKAARNIQMALDNNQSVIIAYVYREPVEAMQNGVLTRAMKRGRTVTIDAVVKGHAGSSEVVRRLQETFGNNPDFLIKVIDNSHGPDGAVISTLDEVPVVKYEGLKEKLRNATDTEFKAGRISEVVHKSTTAPYETGPANGSQGQAASNEPGNRQAVREANKPGQPGYALSRAEQKNPAASRVEGTSADRFKRTEQLQQAAADLQEGKITRDEYNRMVDQLRPVYPYESVPAVTTPKDARYALATGKGQSPEKAAKYGAPSLTLKTGDWAQLRLDIPSYQVHDAWVVSVHTPKSTNREVQAAYDAGPVVGYESVAALKDVTFGMNQKAAVKIATGSAKGTIATMLGKWSPISKADAKARADKAINDPAWTQVGMDPFRHSYFYDRDSMRPVLSADEVIQVGPLVLAKNVKFGQDVDVTGAPIAFSSKQTTTPEFKRWFKDSKVVDDQGKPMVVYRGEHGASGDMDFQSRVASLSFGTKELANLYAEKPNRFGDVTVNPRVIPAYVRIENPLINTPGDPFIELSDVIDKLGMDVAKSAARKLYDDIYNSGPWYSTYSEKYEGIDSLIKEDPEALRNLYVLAWKFFDDSEFVNAAKKAGYDGAIHAEYGAHSENEQGAEYKVFDQAQVKSAIGNSGAFAEGAGINFSRKPRGRETEGWVLSRDELGRFRFGAGAKAYRYAADIANVVLDKINLKPISPELSRALRKMRVEVEKAQNLTVDVAKNLKDLPKQEREMISDVIEGELKKGAMPPQRVLDLAASMQSIMSEQTAELVRLGMLSPQAAGRWDGKYLPRFYEQKLGDETKAWAKAVKGLLGRKKTMQGIRGSSLKARGMFQNVPVGELDDWTNEGWQVRDDNFDPAVDDTITVWRDYTRDERDDMGEIRDAMFRFVMGYNKSQRDIALGRLYENLASGYGSKREQPGYVQVPATKVEDTMVPVYGKLSGMWVPQEVLDQLSAFDQSMQNDLTKMYLKGLSMWKEGKTVLNPVAHANNVLSNLTMAHFAGVSYWDTHKYVGAIADLVRGKDMVQEASDAGLFGGTFNRAELLKVLPEELKAMAQMTESAVGRNVDRLWNALSLFLRKPMGVAYDAEDQFFRYLIYRDARNRGLDVDDSVDYAQKYIFTYDDLPKAARIIRDMPVGLPFFSYTYKAIPALANTALEHPFRYAAPAVALYTANALMYAMAASLGGGDDEDWWTVIRRYMTDEEFRNKTKDMEKQERQFLPEWMKGASLSLGTEKTIRLGMDDLTNLPVFLDVSRIFPGGDLFDAHNNAGGVPLLAPLTPNNPILTTAAAMLFNKDTFRNKDIVLKTDTDAEAAQKRLAWTWKQVAPAISVGNTHFERAMNVIANSTGQPVNVGLAEYTGIGADGLPIQAKYAAMQTVGIKARPIDLDTSEQIQASQTKAMIRDLDTQMRKLKRLEGKGAITPESSEREREKLKQKKQFLKEGLTVEGEEKD